MGSVEVPSAELALLVDEDNVDEDNAQDVSPTKYGSVLTEVDPEEGRTSNAPERASGVRGSRRGMPRRLSSVTRLDDSCWANIKIFTAGTLPQSIVLAIVIGTCCGIGAFLYYELMEYGLEFIWHFLPEKYVEGTWSEDLTSLWIPIVGFSMALCVGLTVVLIGEPGDLAFTVKNVHEKGFLSTGHAMPMVLASLFSIWGGSSLGPEAPLVAICAAVGGYVSRVIFKQKQRNIIRKHTLMGMAGALAAFFGCPLGGSLFALEVNSRLGIEYFEHSLESIFCGIVCMCVFRTLAGLEIGPIWSIQADKLTHADVKQVLVGAVIGLMGAAVASLFAAFHWRTMELFSKLGLLDNKRAALRALVGATVVVAIGVMIPHTMFWGENEFQVISTLSPTSELPHVWPARGLFGFETQTIPDCLLLAGAKLVTISLSVAGGYRGGFIFPLFATGAALGRAFVMVFPSVSVPLATLCFAAGINVAITRTALATTLILSYLSGEQNLISGLLASSIVSLFATSYLKFIKTQVSRSDIENRIYYIDDDDEE